MVLSTAFEGEASAAHRVKTANGVIEATTHPGSGVRRFQGIPFAHPPVGDVRWREPQPVKNWTGVRNADKFAPRCMQQTLPAEPEPHRDRYLALDAVYAKP